MSDDRTSDGTTHGRSSLSEETRLLLGDGTGVLGRVSVLGRRGGGGGGMLSGLVRRGRRGRSGRGSSGLGSELVCWVQGMAMSLFTYRSRHCDRVGGWWCWRCKRVRVSE